MNAKLGYVRAAHVLIIGLLLLAACDGVTTRPEVAGTPDRVERDSALRVNGPPLSTLQLQSLGIVDPVRHSLRFTDRHGEYAAVFSRRVMHDEDPVDGVVTDRILLSVALHSLPASQFGKATEWQHSADIECDGLDIEADFYPASISVTDLDGDGTAELTFAYHRFCGGGIDPRDVTVVLQESGRMYVLEGQTLVRVGDDPPFGGEFKMDAALNAAPQWLQDTMLSTFKKLRDESVAPPAGIGPPSQSRPTHSYFTSLR